MKIDYYYLEFSNHRLVIEPMASWWIEWWFDKLTSKQFNTVTLAFIGETAFFNGC